MKTKTTFISVIITIITSVIFINCAQTATKPKNNDKTKTVDNPTIVLLGNSIQTLITKKYIEYNTQSGTKYTLVNKTFGGIEFPEVEINCYCEQCDTIRNISYASLLPNELMNNQYTKLLLYLKNKYGNPTKETRKMSYDKVAVFTKSIWKFENMTIGLFSTVPRYERQGTLILLFVNPKDINKFDTFFK